MIGFKCELCDARLAHKCSREAIEWDWFTGYLERTFYFCPKHKNSQEARDLLKRSRVKPDEKQ